MPPDRRPLFRARDLVPLVAYVVPTAGIGYGIVLPRNDLMGSSEITLGFAGAIAGACVTYVVGVIAARRS
jgi:hypothetical protein